jgi:predicted phosphoribosyltransferase
MPNEKSIELARRARTIYDERYKAKLEATNADDFVAIEPDSGDFFLGKTLSEAIQAARAVHPQRIPFAVRVGHEATVELGVLLS